MSDSKAKQLLENQLPDFIAIREHLHANPELSFQEFKTAKFVSNKLTECGIEHQSGIAGTGILGIIKGKKPESRVIALRADMDALPILEENEVDYKSKNQGVMHACGHDVHTTCLLGTAKLLQETKENWEGTIKLIFQPGEEKSPGGASLLIKEGVLENPKPQAIFALHVYPNLPSGAIGMREGQYMASCDEIHITIRGKGGHAALPHQTIDPIVIAAQVILSLQTLISRRHNNAASPSVLSFGKIEGGQVGNVIPNEVKLAGTLRCMDEAWRGEAKEIIKKQVKEMAQAMGGDAAISMPPGYPFLTNDPKTTQRARAVLKNAFGENAIYTLNKRMTAEDFSFYTHEIPGCFMRLGTSYKGKFEHPVHHPQFDIHQDSIQVGIKMLYEIATKF
jgi:hippurate hydrolase